MAISVIRHSWRSYCGTRASHICCCVVERLYIIVTLIIITLIFVVIVIVSVLAFHSGCAAN